MNTRKTIAGAALAGLAFVGGAGTAAMLAGGAAGAQDSTTPSTVAPTTDPAAGAPEQTGPHTANGKTEAPVAADVEAKVQAAVLAAEPGATIERVETDADGATYEAHITKADGTRATVLLDENFNVTGTETGRGGPGGPGGGKGGPHAANGKTEEVLTGDLAAKATAAALAAEPGATVDRVETDADGATYEAHITKADGTKATILFDENFNVTGTETGHGPK